ncbi:MAG: biotin-independent malonate decarboxylase subunit beta [Mycobacterium leprae]
MIDHEMLYVHTTPQPCCQLARQSAHVGSVGFGDLEVLLERSPLNGQVSVRISTPLQGREAIWQHLLQDWVNQVALGDAVVTIHDNGATPVTVVRRLDELLQVGRTAPGGIVGMAWDMLQASSFYLAEARDRARGIADAGTFRELLGPEARFASPHLAEMGFAVQWDDGLVAGIGRLGQRLLFVLSMDGRFSGGSMGEVFGAKLVGVMRLALQEYRRHHAGLHLPPNGPALAILFETGGVRLQEANAGLLANAEVMDALQDLRGKVPTIALVGGKLGAFGGLGFVAAATDVIIMNEQGRMGLTGPKVVEQEMGTEEFDAGDLGLVWRTTGGRHRWLVRDANYLAADRIGAMRTQLQAVLDLDGNSLEAMRRVGSRALVEREAAFVHAAIAADVRDSRDLWRCFGNREPEELERLPLELFMVEARRRSQE